MRYAKALPWMILAVGCSGRAQIGHDLPDAGELGSGGTQGKGGAGAVGGNGGMGGTGGSSTGGAGGASASGGVGGSGGVGATGGAGGLGGATGGAGTGIGGATVVGGGGGVGGSGGTGTGGVGGTGAGADAGGADASSPPSDGGRVPPWPAPTQCPPLTASPLTGTWVGNIVNYEFPSGSSLVHLFIEGADDTSFCGSITFGVGQLPPPATDPNIGYPPGAKIDQNGLAWSAPYEAFGYRLSDASVTGDSIHFHVRGFEVWKGWCTLQTSYRSDRDIPYRCVPNGAAEISAEAGADGGEECGVLDTFGQKTIVDCDKLNLCGGFAGTDSVCECNAFGCNAHALRNLHEVSAQLDGNELKGNVRFTGRGGDLVYTVSFTRN